jgi:membrane-bound lytic murein transglycosylase B
MSRACLAIALVALVTAGPALHAAAPAAAGASSAGAAPAPRFDLERAEIKSFISDVAKRNSMPREHVRALLRQAAPQPRIIELMSRPAERVAPWWEYRARFITERRIDEGVQFWRQHREILEATATQRGVAPEYLVAIIGVETYYGRITGSYRVIDALATLAFDYPPRSTFFRSELEQFLLLVREEKVDPLKTTGSYAGAMGAPQFMPSSYRRYAVDGGADQRRNLWEDWDDVIASVANYFRVHGWQTGAPVLAEVHLDPDPSFQIDPRNLELNETLGSLSAQGVQARIPLPPDTPAMLLSAEQQDGPAYRVGFKNFQVITRYNRSVRYAMAVHDLAQQIAARVSEQPEA